MSLPRNLLVTGAFTLALVGVGASGAVAADPVTPGAFCKTSDVGTTGHTVTGLALTCGPSATDTRNRWRDPSSMVLSVTPSPSRSTSTTLVPAQLAATAPGFPTGPAVALGTTLVLAGAGAQVFARRRTSRRTSRRTGRHTA